MKNWQFWLLLSVLAIWLFGINAQLGDLHYQAKEIFNQRWMTWKMDQSGSERIKVDPTD